METVTIDKFVPGGQGIGTLASGKKAFVWGVLPGETVEFEITKNKSSFCEGVAQKVITSSEHRIKPKDPCYLATSPWQVMGYKYELSQKSELVQESFRQNQIELPKLSPATTDGKDFFYRNKMEYSLYWNNETSQIDLAFNMRGTHRKMPINQSSLECPEVFEEAKRLVAGLNAEQKSARDYQAVLVRANQTGVVSSGIFQKHQPHPKMPSLTDKIMGQNYTYSPNGFFQINLPVYELALKSIQKHIKTDKALDLYAGVGTIGLSVARNKELTLVEVNGAAYEELAKNCPPTAKPVLAKSEEVLEFITNDTTVILDPPRAGCDSKLIEKLLEASPPVIIYLSCNPVTQARDVAALATSYSISAVEAFNFFPRTPHIENLVILSKIS